MDSVRCRLPEYLINMIVDYIENIASYKNISPQLSAGLDFIAAMDKDISAGTHQIQDGVKAVVSEYRTRPAEGQRYETHEKAIDIQCLIRGREIIRWLPVEDLSPVTGYDNEKDIRFYSASAKGTDVILSPGLFVIFFPEDGHCPGLCVETGPEPVKKVVVKVCSF
ncbi:MAG: YhcH/YjgK/YiaL family protein [Candidatus Omnitrophota bacterium]